MDVPFGVRVRTPCKQTDGLLPECEPAGNSGLLVVVALDDSSLACLLPWWREHERFLLLFAPDRVSWPHRPAVQYAGIDAHVGLGVPGRGAQDAQVGRQVPLEQRRHHTARAGARDLQTYLLPDGQGLPDPPVLHGDVLR